jgi:hypothetical protein
LGNTCVEGRCLKLPSTISASCSVQKSCDIYAHNVICNNNTNVCIQAYFRSAGQQCRFLPGGGYAVCSALGTCVGNVCQAGPADHGTCNEADGRYCMWPALCSNGTRMLPTDTPTCGAR